MPVGHLFDVRVVKEDPDFHLGVEEERGVVVAVIADDADEVELGLDGPVRLHQRVEHLSNTQRQQHLNSTQ